MRQSRANLVVSILAVLTLGWGVAGIGCSSASSEAQCFATISTVAHSVDLGMRVAGDLYRSGKITEVQKNKAIALYDKYQHAGIVIAIGCRGIGDQASADKLSEDARQAALELLAFINALKKGA